jgi:hypothetical protein
MVGRVAERVKRVEGRCRPFHRRMVRGATLHDSTSRPCGTSRKVARSHFPYARCFACVAHDLDVTEVEVCGAPLTRSSWRIGSGSPGRSAMGDRVTLSRTPLQRRGLEPEDLQRPKLTPEATRALRLLLQSEGFDSTSPIMPSRATSVDHAERQRRLGPRCPSIALKSPLDRRQDLDDRGLTGRSSFGHQRSGPLTTTSPCHHISFLAGRLQVRAHRLHRGAAGPLRHPLMRRLGTPSTAAPFPP